MIRLKGTVSARKFIAVVSLGLLIGIAPLRGVAAVTNPQNGSVGLEATISTAPPATPATITTPNNGQVFTSLPISVNGLCTKGLIVKVFSNNIFVGSATCSSGSYSIQIDLFSGENDLIVRNYDALDQASPDSNTVKVTFNDNQTFSFGSRVSLTSAYAKRGADPGTELDWPIIISGGEAPYAISTDWGDGSAAVLQSEPFAGEIIIKHVYQSAGVYRVVVKATDHSGTTAFLQLIGVGNGKASALSNTTSSGNVTSAGSGVTQSTKTKVIWWPAAVALPLLVVTFWIGQRYELLSLRRKLEEGRSSEG